MRGPPNLLPFINSCQTRMPGPPRRLARGKRAYNRVEKEDVLKARPPLCLVTRISSMFMLYVKHKCYTHPCQKEESWVLR